MTTHVTCFDMAGAGDVSALEIWLKLQPLAQLRRLAVFAKTEGHHAPNDFSRDLLKLKLEQLFARLGITECAMSMLAIGSEGVGSPKGFVFADFADPTGSDAASPREERSESTIESTAIGTEEVTGEDINRAAREDSGGVGNDAKGAANANKSDKDRLVLGTARSEPVPIKEIGTLALVDRVTETARAALRDAGLAPEQARLLMVKSPLLAARHPAATAANSTMHRGRAISALGGGVALGEVDRSRLTEEAITQDLSIYSRHVQAITGAEITQVEVIALGNRPGAAGKLRIATTHTRDILDQRSIRALLASEGFQFDAYGELLDGDRIEALIAKTMVAEDNLVRGSRTIVYASSWAPESHIRAAASGVLGSLLGHLRFFVSADSVHQAPPGGGVTCVVFRDA